MTVAFAPAAPLVIYRNDIEMAFNRRNKLLFNTVLTNFQAKGYQAVFEVADADASLAKTRGANGDISFNSFTQAQYTATMEAKFAPYELSKENVLYSQGDLERVMTEAAAGQINRTIDSSIITTLDAATQEYNSSSAPLTNVSINTFVNIKAKLMQARVPNNGEIFCVVNPSIEASLLTLPNVTNIMYTDKKNLQNPDSLDWADQIKMYEFAGLKFIVMPDLPGMGTALETNYVYHKKSVGLAHLMGGEGPTVDAGYDGRQKRYWVNADFIMGSKIIQNTGIYKFYSDATALLQS
jgi:hypothetical protein